MVESELEKIIEVIKKSPNALSRKEIRDKLSFKIPETTLYRRLNKLVKKQIIKKKGQNRWTKYFLAEENITNNVLDKSNSEYQPKIENNSSLYQENIFSAESKQSLEYLNNPPYTRKSVTYNIDFLDLYEPNKTFYLPKKVRKELSDNGKRLETVVAAGTYARQIINRLLIDLSYNSSRLEGNTYSELDTQRLIEESITAEGKVHEETVMIMNHKDAISFLVDNANEIDLNSFTIRNIHNLLAQDLLEQSACGDIRKREVSIMKSSYKPLSGYIILKEKLELLLLKAKRIQDPFEQSFFLLLQISYLQAFEDVNKRTARLACNIPFIKENLCPLSFVGLPKEDYISAILIFYECNDVKPMVDLFRWAYLKSCERYDAVRQSIGNVDKFRVTYRKQRKECIGEVIRQNFHGNKIEDFAKKYCRKNNINKEDKFVAMIVTELDVLHSGAIVGTGISESQFNKWKQDKNKKE